MPDPANEEFSLWQSRPSAHEGLEAKALVKVSSALALLVALGGALVLFGWGAGIQAFKSLFPGYATMKANTALCFCLTGLALGLMQRWGPRSAWRTRGSAVLSCAAAALGLLTLVQYATGIDLGIDEALFAEQDGSPPGRMAPMTAVNFSMAGAALLLIDVRTRRGRRPAHWLCSAIAANSYVAALGYLYDVDALYRLGGFSSVALHTTSLFLLLSLGIVCARPDSHFVQQIIGSHAAGSVNRRLLPMALIVPPLLGWVRWQGEIAGLYSTAFGLALYAACNVLVFAALAWWSAASLNRLDERRRAGREVRLWQESILNSAHFTVISTDPDGLIRTFNSVAESKLGYAAAEVIGVVTPLIFHDPEEVVERARHLSRELGSPVPPDHEALVSKARLGQADENEWTFIRKDGSRYPVQLSVTRLQGPDDELTGFVGIGKDLTDLRAAQAALLESEQRAHVIADNIPAMVAYIDAFERYQFVNARLCEGLGLEEKDLLGRTILEVRGAEKYAAIVDWIRRPLRGEPMTFQGPGPGRHAHLHYRFSHLPDVRADGTIRGFYAFAFDITDLKVAEAELVRLAQHDALTGLANRNRFNEHLSEAIARSERRREAMCVMYLDLDRFKAINDSLGHAGGDLVLQEFARRLSRSVRATDLVARLGGDEFVILLEGLHNLQEASSIAKKILGEMQRPIVVDGSPLPLSTSIGIAVRRQGETDSEAIVRRADQALYRAKEQGRARFHVDD
jgi:diguanylate cyclase (GGDEF)-like protein/PAS domain S-box-containing protein